MMFSGLSFATLTNLVVIKLMLLLHIEKNKIKERNLFQISHLQNLIEKIKKKILLFTKLKKGKKLRNLRFLVTKMDSSEDLNYKYQNLIKYVIGISLYNTNTIIYIADVKGIIRFCCTAGSANMKRKERKKKMSVIIKLVKFMMLKTNIIFEKDLVALHLKNFNQRLGLFTISLLLKYYNIELIKIYNNEPHNGCRPKKQKRKKKQRLNFRKI